jgi:hypothetical protein
MQTLIFEIHDKLKKPDLSIDFLKVDLKPIEWSQAPSDDHSMNYAIDN